MKGSPHTVSDVMTRTVVASSSGAAFKEIVRVMRQWRVSALPVVDEGRRVVGVVSEADLLRKQEARDDPGPAGRAHRSASDKAGAVLAQQLMTTPAVTVHPEATLAQSARLMARHRVKRLPVVDDEGVLVGIVSRTDLLKVFLRDDEEIAEEVRRDVVAGRFPDPMDSVGVEVQDGVVILTGRVRDTTVVPLAVRLVRTVEGVVDVRCSLGGPRHRPLLEPDLAESPDSVKNGETRSPA
ncbi:CBS domain-containing protein [Streptomyces sp. NPDC089424]|uniref:CBS domain-containing protein n=1 Tax=Streptomyces sp. NPDC089424 TaxID=3365917 RepID=UPI00382752DC